MIQKPELEKGYRKKVNNERMRQSNNRKRREERTKKQKTKFRRIKARCKGNINQYIQAL